MTCDKHPARTIREGQTCDACRCESEYRLLKRHADFSLIDELTAEQYAAWDRWFIKAVTGVLILVAMMCVWMGAINRGLAEKYGQDKTTEARR